jgi:hypothetical protein
MRCVILIVLLTLTFALPAFAEEPEAPGPAIGDIVVEPLPLVIVGLESDTMNEVAFYQLRAGEALLHEFHVHTQPYVEEADGVVQVRHLGQPVSRKHEPSAHIQGLLAQAKRFVVGDVELLINVPGFTSFTAQVFVGDYEITGVEPHNTSSPKLTQRLGWIKGSLDPAVQYPAPYPNGSPKSKSN